MVDPDNKEDHNVHQAERLVVPVQGWHTAAVCSDFTAICESDGPVVWKKRGYEDVYVEGHTTKENNKYVSKLVLKDITYLSVGFYDCVSGTSDGKASFYLYVDDPVHLTLSPDHQEVNSASYRPAVVPCIPTAPDVFVKLLTSKRELMADSTTRSSGPDERDIYFDPHRGFIMPSHLMEPACFIYICEFSKQGVIQETNVDLYTSMQCEYGDSEKSLNGYLKVKMIVPTEDMYKAAVGSDFTAICESDDPLVWKKRGNEDVHVDSHTTNVDNKYVSKLVLKDISYQSVGFYDCLSETTDWPSPDEAFPSFYLYVEGPVRLTLSPDYQRVNSDSYRPAVVPCIPNAPDVFVKLLTSKRELMADSTTRSSGPDERDIYFDPHRGFIMPAHLIQPAWFIYICEFSKEGVIQEINVDLHTWRQDQCEFADPEQCPVRLTLSPDYQKVNSASYRPAVVPCIPNAPDVFVKLLTSKRELMADSTTRSSGPDERDIYFDPQRGFIMPAHLMQPAWFIYICEFSKEGVIQDINVDLHTRRQDQCEFADPEQCPVRLTLSPDYQKVNSASYRPAVVPCIPNAPDVFVKLLTSKRELMADSTTRSSGPDERDIYFDPHRGFIMPAHLMQPAWFIYICEFSKEGVIQEINVDLYTWGQDQCEFADPKQLFDDDGGDHCQGEGQVGAPCGSLQEESTK